MQSKTNTIREAIAAGDTRRAVSIASKFHDRSEDTKLFKTAQDCYTNPAFMRQVGKDPAAIIAQARARLMERFYAVAQV
jgi:hypothetical protein